MVCFLLVWLIICIAIGIIKKVVRTVEENKVFRIKYKKKLRAMSEAIRYYYQFAREYSESIAQTQEQPEITEVSQTFNSSPVSEKTSSIEITEPVEKEETFSETEKPQISETEDIKRRNAINPVDQWRFTRTRNACGYRKYCFCCCYGCCIAK